MSGHRSYSRRQVLLGTAGAAAALATPYVQRAHAQDNRIVCRDSGLGTTFQDLYAEPFRRATGIEVVPAVSQTEPVGLIKQMIETKTYTWDMASGMSDSAAYQLTVDGDYVEELNLSGAAVWNDIPDHFKSDTFVAAQVVASVMGYNTAARQPKSWADFWNVAEFPGRRGLRGFPLDTIEIALMADGVPVGDVYPCDLDRAFTSLDRIKPHIDVWWANGAQSAQLLQSGEVEYINTWNGRVQGLIDAGLPLAINWNEALWGGNCFLILKGTPKADLCREFIKFCLQPEQQAAYANASGYGYTNPNALPLIDAAIAKKLPTHPDNAFNARMVDYRFWSSARQGAVDRMNQWLL